MGDKVADLHIAIDPGTTTWTVCWRWSSSRTVHTLKFSSTYSEKNNEELDATIGRSQSHWYYGLDVRHLDVQKFVNIKLGIIGEEPYTRQLKESFQAARRVYGVEETPVTLFANLFKHILMTLAEQCLEAPESEALMSGRRFHDIRKLCWITHPVRHNESLRIILFEAALAAKFHRVDGVSESMAAAHFMAFQTKHQLFPPDKTALIVDCGGGSTDFVGVYREPTGRIRQVSPTDGFNQGGLMVNRAFQKWLYESFPDHELLTASRSWATISAEFEGCKRVFNGIDSVHLDVFGERIHISAEIMAGFFGALRKNILEVFCKQYAAAKEKDYVPELAFITGGNGRNRWFAKSIFDAIQKLKPEMTCAAETHVGTVAQGALSFAQNPISETSVAGEDVGLTFLVDRSMSGAEWSANRVEEAIGWVIEKGQPAGKESRVELIKKVYRDRPGRPNQVISSDLFTTTERFERLKMRSDHDVDWDCRITFPLDGVRSHLVYLGRIEADIPHAELFPPRTTHREVEAHFKFSIKPEGQLLNVDVSLQLEDDLLLQRSYLPAAGWTPQSELDLEQGRRRAGPSAFFPPGRAKRRRRKSRERHLLPTVKSCTHDNLRMLEQPVMGSHRRASTSPSMVCAREIAAEKSNLPTAVDRRSAKNDNSHAEHIPDLPRLRRIVRHSLGRKDSFLLSPLPASERVMGRKSSSLKDLDAPGDTSLDLSRPTTNEPRRTRRSKVTELPSRTKAFQ